jgi:hypothetical protein
MRVPVHILLLGVVLGGLVLAGVLASAWALPEDLRRLLGGLQTWYGAASPVPWWARSDVHLHALVAACSTAWLSILFRLAAPRLLPWLPPALVIVVQLADELAQTGSESRSADWGDLAGGLCGVMLALPVVWFAKRLAVEGGARITTRTRTPGSRGGG